MNKALKELLVGTLLGDASIRRSGINKAIISFEQSNKKIDYINYLFKETKEGGLPLSKDTLSEYTRFDSRYSVTNKSLAFRSQPTEDLIELADLFLDNDGKKKIPSNIAEVLTHRSLAF